MLIVTALGPSAVRYFLDGRHPGVWSPGAADLLGLRASPERRDLRMVLQGRDPTSGRYLLPVHSRRRRGGWDLVFSAPKSLSLLASGLEPEAATAVRSAHRDAVTDVIGHLETQLVLRRMAPSGAGVPAEGLIAATFEHDRNSAAERHLHSHVVIANLSRSGGTWGCLSNRAWFVERTAYAALYQLGLRHHLARQGWPLEWRVGADGLADLADVPTAAIRSASSQSRVVAASGRVAARTSGQPRLTRSEPDDPAWLVEVGSAALANARRAAGAGQAAGAGRGLAIAAGSGQGMTAAAGAGGSTTTARGTEPDRELTRRVEVRLSTRRSDFRLADVVVALASSHPEGMAVPAAVAWAERFCAAQQTVPSPTRSPRWTTAAARRSDEELIRVLGKRHHRGSDAAAGRPDAVANGPEVRGEATSGAATVDRILARLVDEGAQVCVLGAPAGRSGLVAHAELLSAGREAWAARGQDAAMLCPTREAALRWEVLCGIPPIQPGRRPGVLVVDQADRRTSADLLRIARTSKSQLVFVEGGTLPRLTNPASHGLVRASRTWEREVLPEVQPWAAGPDRGPHQSGPSVGREAAGDLLQRWHAAGREPLLVGLGPEEVWALNRAALGENRSGPGVARFRGGDRVVVLRGRAGLPPAGTLGTVTRVSPPGLSRHPELSVCWPGGRQSVLSDGRTIGALGFGYAVTPRLAARSSGPIMVLGPSSALGRSRNRIITEMGAALLRPRGPRHRAAMVPGLGA
jgi:conjugative relaxase-like TrwC/TraI family protein